MDELESYMTTKSLMQYPNDPLGYAGRLEFSAEEVAALPVRDDGSRRFVCTLEEIVSWHAALIPDGTSQYFIIVNKERIRALERAGHDLSRLSLKLVPDKSTYGMDMPPELGELLVMEPEVDRYFHDLTPGKQRALIHLVAKPKGEATRLRKAVAIVEYLRDVRGKLDFKELQQALKVRR